MVAMFSYMVAALPQERWQSSMLRCLQLTSTLSLAQYRADEEPAGLGAKLLPQLRLGMLTY